MTTKNSGLRVWLLLAVLALIAATAVADVRLPAVIGDNMVLQSDKPLWIWGWADPREKVTVSIAGESCKTRADRDGCWVVKMPGVEAGCPVEFTVKGKNFIRLRNVAAGEVWLCSGQSNMEWPLESCENAENEITSANHPDIRILCVPRTSSGYPVCDTIAEWKTCSPETAAEFSGVAYYFALSLQAELNVPVGLIGSYWGGTPIEPWTPPVGFESAGGFDDVLAERRAADEKFASALPAALDHVQDWLKSVRRAVKRHEATLPSLPPWPQHDLSSHRKPTGLFNGMIHPLVPFTLRGAIWYQGESNLRDGAAYFPKMKALIGGWRQVWGQGDFPFYYVQLAPYRYKKQNDPNLLPGIWEAQTMAMSLPQTGMAVTTDIGNLDDIHPKNKLDVAKRLSLWALAKTYGRAELVHSGPLYRSMAVEGGTVRIYFDHIGSGLASSDGGSLTWFTIAGADRVFVEAQARIDGDTVLVSSQDVAEPAAVRFGWHEEAEPNLANKEGLPASPFRTDRW